MWLREPLAVSLAAQVGVTPVLLATFGTVPVVTPLANLLAAPAAEAVGVYGMLASAVGGCGAAGSRRCCRRRRRVLIAWITAVARPAPRSGSSSTGARACCSRSRAAVAARRRGRGAATAPR